MLYRLILFTLLLLSSACTSDSTTSGTTETTENSEGTQDASEVGQQQEDNSSADSTDFDAAFNNFFQALQTADTATINKFIHPMYGVWFIEQPGALPKMTFVTDIRDFKREYQGRSFFTVADDVKKCNLQEEPFPGFDCADMNYDEGKTGYSKDGCFVWKPDKFQKSGYWNYADLSMQEVKRVQTTLPQLEKSVLHTQSSFEFHFGHIEGHWRLLFAKLIYPCSA